MVIQLSLSFPAVFNCMHQIVEADRLLLSPSSALLVTLEIAVYFCLGAFCNEKLQMLAFKFAPLSLNKGYSRQFTLVSSNCSSLCTKLEYIGLALRVCEGEQKLCSK